MSLILSRYLWCTMACDACREKTAQTREGGEDRVDMESCEEGLRMMTSYEAHQRRGDRTVGSRARVLLVLAVLLLNGHTHGILRSVALQTVSTADPDHLRVRASLPAGGLSGIIPINPPAEAAVNTVQPLVFQLADAAGQPLPTVGVLVRFELRRAPMPRRADSLPASLCSETPGSPGCPNEIASTDAAGQATVFLTVGHTSGEIEVDVQMLDDEASTTVTLLAQPDLDSVRQVEVSGNNQTGEPGQELPEPLVVRLEDQFGNPIPESDVTARVIQGDAEFVTPGPEGAGRMPRSHLRWQGFATPPTPAGPEPMVTIQTDVQGEARFFLRIGAAEREVVRVEVSADAFPQAEPIQFVALVGFPFVRGIEVEADGSLVVADVSLNAVLRVHPVTGNRRVVSGAGVGSGTPLATLFDIAIEADGSLVIAQAVLPRARSQIVRIDPRSGVRTLVTEGDDINDSGATLVLPFAVAVEGDGSLVVADATLGAVVRIDPVSGARRIVSGGPDNLGSGPPFLGRLFDIAVASDGALLVTSAAPQAAVIRIDPVSGARTIVSGAEVGSGPRFVNITAIAVERDGALVVTAPTDSGAAVFRVDPVSGARTIVSGAEVGSGPRFVGLSTITVERDGALIVGDFGRGALLRVDPRRGDRTIVSEARFGNGPPFILPLRIATERDGSLIVIDAASDAVIRVDPVTGDRIVVSDATTGTGPPFQSAMTVAVEADGALLVVDNVARAVLRVDPRRGDRTIVSGGVTPMGNGPPLLAPFSIAIDADGALLLIDLGQRLLASSMVPPAVVQIDAQSGDRTIVSGGAQNLGSGPPLQTPMGLAIEADGSIVVADCGGVCALFAESVNTSIPPAVVRVDRRRGDRTTVLGPPDTARVDLLFSVFSDIVVQADGALVLVGGFIFTATVWQIDPLSGAPTLISGVTPLGQTAGSGPPLSGPFGVAITPDGALVIADLLLGAVVAVDPLTGRRTIVSK